MRAPPIHVDDASPRRRLLLLTRELVEHLVRVITKVRVRVRVRLRLRATERVLTTGRTWVVVMKCESRTKASGPLLTPLLLLCLAPPAVLSILPTISVVEMPSVRGMVLYLPRACGGVEVRVWARLGARARVRVRVRARGRVT